ncbi:THAP domain-containing protein 5-like [Lasioglossum baleicum]|uniref:THAP domain-containing protein 5-like n=1 Tax=Lasioglossum baleicum TaxID=434251 RepID=UPI003FCE10AA
MGKCLVCGKLSNNKTKTSLHGFPRDEALCKQWVKEIGREGWMPTNSSYICSDHFPEDSIAIYYNRKRLKPGSVPTILPKKSTCEPQRNILRESNGRDNNGVLATIEEVPEPMIVVECNNPPITSDHSPITSNQTFNKDFSSPCTSKTADVREECQHIALHDHRYCNTPRSTMKKLGDMRKRLQSTIQEKRLLKQQVTRLKKRYTLYKMCYKD